ncbi:MAG: hypothetical protein AAGD92_01385 [Pseudomonadota bacterium]
MSRLIYVFALLLTVSSAFAGEADVIDARAEETAPGVWTFSVTVRHGDEGWDHYADRWDVMIGDEVIATRVLAHPHEHEQPFTRSLSGVEIPGEVEAVTIRARDSVHGYGGAVFTLTLPR